MASTSDRSNAMHRSSATVMNVGARYPMLAVQNGIAHGDQSRQNLAPITLRFPRPAHYNPSLLGHGMPAYRPSFIQYDAGHVDDTPLDLSRSSPQMVNGPLDLSRTSQPNIVPMANLALPVEAQASVVNVHETKAKKKEALKQTLIEYSLPVTQADRDVEAFLRAQESNIRSAVEEAIRRDM